MAFGGSRPVEFAPLNVREDDTTDIEVQLLGQSSKPCFTRPACWTLCSATAVYTTKRLMINNEYHYPLTIAFHSFLAIFVAYCIALYLSSKSLNTKEGLLSRWGIGFSRPEDLWPNTTWIFMIPASLAAGASLPMFLEGLLHMPSLPALVMLFPIIYAVEALILFICCSPSRNQTWLPWEALVSTLASAAILYNEYRLMVPGLIWGVSGILFIGVARALFTIGSDRCGSELVSQARLQSYHGFIVLALGFGLFLSILAGFFVEHPGRVYSTPRSSIWMIVFNAASMIGSAFTGTTLLAYSPISFTYSRPGFSNIPLNMYEFIASSISSLLVLLVAIHSSPVSYVSWVQIASYLAASIFLVGAPQIHSTALEAMDRTNHQITKSLDLQPIEDRKRSRIFTSGTLFILIVFFAWTISSLSSLAINSIPPSIPPSLDTHYQSNSNFDIVVSMYKESPSSVRHMIDSIKNTKYLSTVAPNIIIYTKDPTADLAAIKSATGASNVIRLENLGREGGTYLHHIVHNWDTLASQTMFIQAHAHNMRELLPRINSYLVLETGMLSLGFVGVLCNCESCGDRWDWNDSFHIIPSLYQKVYGQKCEPDTPLLLTYKGQFVASGRRIRGVKKEVYEELLDAITSKEGWSHDKNVIGDRENTPDNPFFGFTVERIWGLLMQCATDGSVAAKCPSLLSGMGRGGDVRDCQCLDREIGERMPMIPGE